MGKRTSYRIHHFILSKAFEVPRNFSRKVSCVRVWGGQPQLTTNTKTRISPRFLYYRNILELRSKPPSLTFLIRKVSKRISHRPHNFILSKVFEIPRDFLQKVPWSGFGAEAPTFNAHIKKHGVAVLFIIYRISY